MSTRNPTLAIATAKVLLQESTTVGVGLAEVAELLSYSPSYISRVFTSHFGLSPMAVRAHHQIQEAKRLLSTTSMPIIDISEQVGRCSLGSFTSRFSRDVGMSPSVYRRFSSRRAGASSFSMVAPTAPRDERLAEKISVTARDCSGISPDSWVRVAIFRRRVATGRPELTFVTRLGESSLPARLHGHFWVVAKLAVPEPWASPDSPSRSAVQARPAEAMTFGRGGPTAVCRISLDQVPSWAPPLVSAF